MRKTTFLKTFLVAICLFGGMNAWAYTVPTGYEIKTVFVGTDNGDNTVTPLNFSSGTYDNTIFYPGTCWHASTSEILKVVDYTYVAPPAVGGSVDGAPYPTYVGSTGKVLQWHSRSNATQYGVIKMSPVTTGKLVFGIDLNFGGNNTNYAPQIIFVDGSGNSVLQLGFSCGSGDTEYFQYKVGDESATNDGTVGTSKLRGKYTGHSIRDIVIDMETGAVVYTVDCIGTDGKRYVKASTKGVNIGTGKTIAGIRLSRNFGASSASDYIWADNIELYTVGEESLPHTYTVKAKAGSTELSTIATGSLKAGQSYTATVTEVIEKDGKFYRLDDATVENYNKSYTMGDAEENHTINYTEDASIVFYSELEGATYTQDNATASGGTVRGFNGSTYVSTDLDNGQYQILVKVTGSRHSKSGSWRGFSMSLGGTEFASMVGQSAAEHSFSLIVPQDGQTLKFYKGYNESDWIDYIIVKKTGDLPANVSKTITAAGWATLFTPYALDFSEVSGLTAYTATCEGSTVTLTAVENVPANTGVVLKGAANTYDIPVITSSTTAQGDLKGSATDAKAYDTSYDYYYLVKNGDNAQFKKLADGGSIAAGKAYLQLTHSSARELSIVFDDETTGIHSIDNGKLTIDNSVYDLSGRRVAKPTKGLYIVNGKKVAVK